MRTWWKQLWCDHTWKYRYINYGQYDEKVWLECSKCKKQGEA